MSGAKVVRIVTREEMEMFCGNLIRAIELEGAELKRIAKRSEEWSSELERTIGSSIEGLQRLVDAQRWTDVQMQAPLQKAFLRSEANRIEAQAISRAESARSRRRHVADSARSILGALKSSGQTVSRELEEIPHRALSADDDELTKMESVVSAGLQILSRSALTADTTEQLDLATRLGAGEKPVSFMDWMHEGNHSREADRRLDGLLAQIEILEDTKVAKSFVQRAQRISEDLSDDQRTLLTDSLVLDLSAHVKHRRQHDAAIMAMREARLSLGDPTDETRVLTEQLDSAIDSGNDRGSSVLVEKALTIANAQRLRTASVSRRRAVLQGLAALGYEIRENMATAWLNSGKIVVRKPGVLDYGVELGATSDASQLQVRVVGASDPVEPRTMQRDRDMEVQWCTDFDKLRQNLAKDGSDLDLQRAVAPGEQPVKTVPMEGTGDLGSTDAAPLLRQRTNPS